MFKRLLILMDDEPVTTRALALDLRDAGYRVETAAGPEEAIRRMRSVPFDLLIAAEERGVEGSRLVDGLRKIHPAAKVVMMTTGEPRRGYRLDASGARVGKPFDLDDMRSLVERLVGKGGEAAPEA
ncbi:MAG TPA: response regulator [bacterium]|nr:response regulator [bacterium]